MADARYAIEIVGHTRGLNRGLRNVDARLKSVGQAANNTGKILRRAFQFLSVGVAVREITRLSDAFLEVQNRLRIVGFQSNNLAQGFDRLLRVSNETRSPLAANARLLARIGIASQDVGATQDEMFRVIELAGKAVAAQGASAQEARSALTQLAQAFGSTIVRAEEFNSVAEGAPVILLAAAKAMGETFASLRVQVTEGQVSSKEFFEALLEGGEVIDDLFRKVTPTVTQALTILNNQLTAIVGSSEQTFGALSILSRALILLAQNLDIILPLLVNFAVTVGSIRLGQFVASLFASANAANTLGVAVRFMGGPIAAIAVGITSLITLMFTFGDQIALTADGSVTLRTVLDSLVISVRLLVDAVGGLGPALAIATTGWLILRGTISPTIVLFSSLVFILHQFNSSAAASAVAVGIFAGAWAAVNFTAIRGAIVGVVLNLQLLATSALNAARALAAGLIPALLRTAQAVRALTASLIRNPLGLLAVGAASGIAALVAYREQLGALGDVADSVVGTIGDGFQSIGDAASGLVDQIPQLTDSFFELGQEAESVRAELAKIQEQAGSAGDEMDEAGDKGTESFKQTASAMERLDGLLGTAPSMFDQMGQSGSNAGDRIADSMDRAASSTERAASAARSYQPPNLTGTGSGTNIDTGGGGGQSLIEGPFPAARQRLAQAVGGRVGVKTSFGLFDQLNIDYSIEGAGQSFERQEQASLLRQAAEQFGGNIPREVQDLIGQLAEQRSLVTQAENLRQVIPTLPEGSAGLLPGLGRGAGFTSDERFAELIGETQELEARFEGLLNPTDKLGDAANNASRQLNSIKNPWEESNFLQNVFGFQTGGQMTVGGSGGPDSQLVALRATPGELITVETPRQRNMRGRDGGGSTVINNQFNIQSPDVESFQRSRSQVLGKIVSSLRRVERRM